MSGGTSTTPPGMSRLEAVLETYGGDPLRWPDPERDALLALLARSAEARRAHDAALRLDSLLDASATTAPSPDLEERIVAAALASGTTDAGANRASVHAIDDARARRAAVRRRPPGRIMAVLPLAAAAALALWISAERARQPGTASAPLPDDVQVASIEVDDLQIASLGVYETPGDVLLAASVLDEVYDAGPWTGCSEGELGCLDTDTLPIEPLSQKDQEVRLLS